MTGKIKGGELAWAKGMCIDAANAALKKNFFPMCAFMSPVEADMERESCLAVMVKAPVRVSILQRCDCGATMHRNRSGKDMVCPACREPLKKTDVVAVVMWD